MNKDDTEPVSVGRKVLHLAAQLRLKPAQLAELLGVDRSTPYSYTRRNRPSNPTQASIDLMIRKLLDERGVQVPREWFFDGKPGDAPIVGGDAKYLRDPAAANAAAGSLSKGDKVRLPLWRGMIAGPDGECFFDEEGSPELYEIPAFITGGDYENHVVGVAAGISMFPRVAPGEHIVIKIDPTPPHNGIVVARKTGVGNYIKAYRVKGNRIELESLNPDFPAICDLAGWEFRGYAIAIIKAYAGGGPNIEWDFGRPLRA